MKQTKSYNTSQTEVNVRVQNTNQNTQEVNNMNWFFNVDKTKQCANARHECNYFDKATNGRTNKKSPYLIVTRLLYVLICVL